MRTEPVTVRLTERELAMIEARAAGCGMTRSAFIANLISRALEAESLDRIPVIVAQLAGLLVQAQKLCELDEVIQRQAQPPSSDPCLRAFMIETLLSLRELRGSDLRLAGEIGRKLQRAVGDVRVPGT
jgi:predicted YcjX-like family ATPase